MANCKPPPCFLVCTGPDAIVAALSKAMDGWWDHPHLRTDSACQCLSLWWGRISLWGCDVDDAAWIGLLVYARARNADSIFPEIPSRYLDLQPGWWCWYTRVGHWTHDDVLSSFYQQLTCRLSTINLRLVRGWEPRARYTHTCPLTKMCLLFQGCISPWKRHSASGSELLLQLQQDF